MPPQRTPLSPISENRLLGQHLSPYMRGRIVGQAEGGATPSKIARDFDLEYSTVYRTIQHDLLRHEGKSLPKTPRKKSYTDADERALLRHVRLNPKDTYKQVKEGTGVTCSRKLYGRSSRSTTSPIGRLNAARFLQIRMQRSGLPGASNDGTGLQRIGLWWCGAISVLQSGGGAKETNGSSARRRRNGANK